MSNVVHVRDASEAVLQEKDSLAFDYFDAIVY